jgi:DNA (cytosine-5)-methyltransferase 1
MKVLSLFSGVGGFDLGLEAAGMETVFQCEWDKHATSILEHHWPDVPRWGDISTLTGKHILQHAPVIDVVAWGSPCQDLSVAGKRGGLTGERSILFHEGVRIIKELREETNNEYPRISIWENVHGAINSNKGADFGVILDEMAEAGALVQEWRVLDAQYFGVPQRRRRVFLVSVFDSATAARCPEQLLPVCESVQWNPAASLTTRQRVAGEVGTSLTDGRAILGSDIVGPLAASDWKFPQQQQVHENKIVLLVACPTNPVLAFDTQFGSNANVHENKSPTIKSSQQAPSVSTAQVVRRLTPIECERLMGWPDNHTLNKSNGTKQSDTQRYKQCGNGVASPVAQWIGEQLVALNNA